MIRINLLPQRRLRGRASASDASARPLLVGVIGLAAAAAAVVVLVDRPKRARLAELNEANAQLQSDIQAKKRQLVGYDELKKSAEEADERYKSIQRLIGAKVVPAHVLHEIGEILTTSKYPTMTEDMARRTGNGPDSDPNRRFQADWDPSHVWLSGFSDSDGLFRLEGGAQTESDVTQLAKRLAASVYFADVTPAGGERIPDSTSGSSYFKFTITGKVVY
ncbi:MAG: PilN domain-containing protein [Deltaproteobacteria bacterium]|nr:MAG: PilN domain-containing protein [Deltaproteobacteria bacterium]TMQ22646.1 MAG: PilN domain-containing protein [Deltaproteobacteria bacterium]